MPWSNGAGLSDSLGWHLGPGAARRLATVPPIDRETVDAELTIVGRVLPEFGARMRTQGLGFSITAVYIAKSLMPHP